MSWGRWDINRLNSQKEIYKRCEELRESLRGLESGKEDFKSSGYFEFFPVLLVNLFGFDNKPGWFEADMKDMKAKEKDIKYREMVKKNIEALDKLLCPGGPIFTIAMRWYRDDRFRYEFPVTRLPPLSQHQLASKNHPFATKVSRAAPDQPPRALLLNVLEYYLFCFCYYIILRTSEAVQAGSSSAPVNLQLYLNLLHDYLQAFSKPSSDNPDNTLYLSMLRVVVEFWLVQYDTMDRVTGSGSVAETVNTPNVPLFAKKDQALPTKEVLAATHTVIKHVVRSGNINLAPVVATIQRPLYRYMRSALDNSLYATNPPLEEIVDIWLTFVQPWLAATTPPQSASQFIEQWSSFVTSNFLLYEAVGLDFFSIARNLDFHKQQNLAVMEKTVDMYLTDGLIPTLEKAEEMLKDAQTLSPFRSGHTAPTTLILQQHCIALDGPRYTPLSMFRNRDYPWVDEILRMLLAARASASATGHHLNKSSPVSSSTKPVRDGDIIAKKLGLSHAPMTAEEKAEEEASRKAAAQMEPTRSSNPLFLTPEGLDQVMKGSRMCSNRDVPFLGAADQRPIASYESAFLVRSLRKVSNGLKTRFNVDVDLRALGDWRNIIAVLLVSFSLFFLCDVLGVSPLGAVIFLGVVFGGTWFVMKQVNSGNLQLT